MMTANEYLHYYTARTNLYLCKQPIDDVAKFLLLQKKNIIFGTINKSYNCTLLKLTIIAIEMGLVIVIIQPVYLPANF